MIPNQNINECQNIGILELRDYVDKCVKVAAKGGKVYEGLLYTVDPVSGCVILFNKSMNTFDFVFGHAVDKISLLRDTGEKLTTLFQTSYDDSGLSEKEMLTKLKNWLLSNRIPVVEVGNELKLGDTLTIVPPYKPNCCLSSNEIVLANVQRLVKSMPLD